ncbi:MAG: hypothetical protein E6240_01875 [Clostridium butyricum]|nr:hypothetical protein [Clostridium butyricum]
MNYRCSAYNLLKKHEINYLRRNEIYITHLNILRLKFKDDVAFRDYVRNILCKGAWFN